MNNSNLPQKAMNNPNLPKKPELMAPAGDKASLAAAIDAGADAVYFGVASFNMRSSAKNFEIKDLAHITKLCHSRGVKAYLALNTIIFNNELKKAEQIIKAAKNAQIDAVICWDFAVIKLAKKYGLEVFLSTQMSVSNSLSLSFLQENLGIKRFVLARECTLNEIAAIKKQSPSAEIEVFAHGAMCVSVSGRCFMSQLAFNSSANRGECRQPCRREYEIRDIRDGKEFLIGKNYVMSPKDLCTMPFLDEILDIGIDSLKIEGRGRSAEYVSVVVGAYREFIDYYFAHRQDEAFFKDIAQIKRRLIEKLNSVFNRGFSNGFFYGRGIKEFSGGNGSKATHRKVYIGTVTNFFKRVMAAEIKCEARGFAVNDELLFTGGATGVCFLRAESIEIDNKPAPLAKKGEVVGVKLSKPVRKNDGVYIMLKAEEVKNAKQ